MADIEHLHLSLRFHEYLAARALEAECISAGVSPDEVPGLIYRRGFLDGITVQRGRDKVERERRRASYAAKTENSPTSGEIEGSTQDESDE